MKCPRCQSDLGKPYPSITSVGKILRDCAYCLVAYEVISPEPVVPPAPTAPRYSIVNERGKEQGSASSVGAAIDIAVTRMMTNPRDGEKLRVRSSLGDNVEVIAWVAAGNRILISVEGQIVTPEMSPAEGSGS